MIRNPWLTGAFSAAFKVTLTPAGAAHGGLPVAVLVLGYLCWERRRNTVEIRLPSVTIEKR